jgi:conjugative transfer pilus assembly protein TraH
MMNRVVHWSAAAAASIFLTVGHSAKADINDALDGMFMVTGTEPAVYESQRRGGVQFGTFRVRAPVTSFNVLNFTPPEVRAGCGGIDLYGGSFTFINTEQFRQVLRQIGANAIGYAFKLALATMCDRCDQILTGLQNSMDEWNRAMKDSCRWAQGLVNDTLRATELSESVKGMTEETNEGVFDDAIEATTDWFADVTAPLGGGDASGKDPDKPAVGNKTWNALQAAAVDGLFDYAGGGLTHHEILMNIAGTLYPQYQPLKRPLSGYHGGLQMTLSRHSGIEPIDMWIALLVSMSLANVWSQL